MNFDDEIPMWVQVLCGIILFAIIILVAVKTMPPMP